MDERTDGWRDIMTSITESNTLNVLGLWLVAPMWSIDDHFTLFINLIIINYQILVINKLRNKLKK